MLRLVFFISMVSCICKAQSNIEAILESYKKDKDLQHATYSFCIIDALSGKTLKEFNSEVALVPASTLKILTTATALGVLGKDFTYKTNFYSFQKKDSITLQNNTHLLIKGSGDPTFNSSYFNSNDTDFTTQLVKNLKDKGLKKITGSIIADASCFNNDIPSTWIWGDIGNYFGAGANGLSYRDNKFSLYYSSGAINSKTTIEKIYPDYFSKKITVQNYVISNGTDDNAYVYSDPNGYIKKITGTIPPNKKNYEVEAAMPEPALFFIHQLHDELKNNSLTNNSISLFVNETPNTYIFNKEQLVYTHTSPKLDKIVYYTNVKSNNHYAESLLKTIGAAKTGKQGTSENGITVIENYWKDRGLDMSGLHMVDGSGLSRANTITTKLQATILSKIYRDSLLYPTFNNSLPIAGKNGSMTNIGKGTFIENNMRAKTGYINRARGYCGYVKTKSGKELAFSVLFNNYDCSPKEMKLKIEKLLVAMAEL